MVSKLDNLINQKDFRRTIFRYDTSKRIFSYEEYVTNNIITTILSIPNKDSIVDVIRNTHKESDILIFLEKIENEIGR